MTLQEMVVEDGTKITVVHLAVEADDESAALRTDRVWRIACAPRMPDLTTANRTAPVMRTDDPRAVNCPLCTVTDDYKAAMAKIRTARRAKT